MCEGRRYRYVGPADVRAAALAGADGHPIGSPVEFERWAASTDVQSEPFTFVVGPDGVLRLAPRRSEHVACAAGGDVLGAGEISFIREPDGWVVTDVTNQSTGYCPDLDSWPAVAAALDRAGLARPAGFTTAFAFRRCPDCRERNLVKDDDFRCAVCGTDLPRRWNIDPDPHALPVEPEHRRRLDFLLAAHELTTVTRVNRLLDGSRSETSAEHSWHLALAALALAPDTAPNVDVSRVVAMLLIHDLPEVYAGDVPIYDEQARLAAVAAEEKAATRLFGKLPADQGGRMLALWHEFERAETDDARFAKAIDRLQPLLLHWASDGAAWAERRVTVAQEQRIMAAVGTYWPSLAPFAEALVDDARRRGMLVEC